MSEISTYAIEFVRENTTPETREICTRVGIPTKPETDLHEIEAAFITEVVGVEISPKQVQAILSMHAKFQASEVNKNRANYRGRTARSIAKGGETTADRFYAKAAAIEAATAPVEPEAVEVETAPEAIEAAPVEAEAAPKPAPRRRRSKKAEAAEEDAA